MRFSCVMCCRSLDNFNVFRTATLFRPQNIAPDLQCTSQKLMFRDGLTFPASTGTLYFLPTFVRIMEKLVRLVDSKMREIGAQKIIAPCLTSGSLFKKSGRWDTIGDELFTLKDRHDQDFCLGPTHEESVTNLMANVSGISYKKLPLMLYQITPKFRDEMRPKFGAMRAREFSMKDMYTFDKDHASAQQTYDLVCKAYSEIFESLEVKVVKVQGSTGTMGGSHSDEYHLLSEIGEDKLLLCSRCNYGINADLEILGSCPQCKMDLEQNRGIEVGHAFLLGTTYSKTFEAHYVQEDSSKEPFYMGCYGMGMTRLIAAIMEVSTKGNECMQWPLLIAPFLVGFIPYMRGGAAEAAGLMLSHLQRELSKLPPLHDNILLDDRDDLSIGRRVNELKEFGVPFVVVLGKKVLEERPKMEIIDVYKEKTYFCTQSELLDFFKEKFSIA